MRRNQMIATLVLLMVLILAACGPSQQQKDSADKTMEALYQARNYTRMMTTADSLEQAGVLSATKANYWRGYAADRMKQKDAAEGYWRSALEAGEQSSEPGDVIMYMKAASRLANLLTMKGDYEATLSMALPAAERMESLRCDTTSDYINLLIYIGCCQAVTGQQVQETSHGFFRAYKKHLENIQKTHSDAAYKDAIAGLINVAYYSVKAGKYDDALNYTRNFGELLGEYEQRPEADASYVDKQLGRYSIYKAKALAGLGRKQEADDVFDSFLQTEFSHTPEGMGLAKDYEGNEK